MREGDGAAPVASWDAAPLDLADNNNATGATMEGRG